jgi:hypothetical protein
MNSRYTHPIGPPSGVSIRDQGLRCASSLLNFIEACGHPAKAIPSKYAHRIHLASRLGLSSEFTKQLVFLGKLRNRFAHDQNAVISKSDAETFDAAHDRSDTEVDPVFGTGG